MALIRSKPERWKFTFARAALAKLIFIDCFASLAMTTTDSGRGQNDEGLKIKFLLY